MPPAKPLLVLAAVSLLSLLLLYVHIPNAVTFDVSFSLFAAQNAAAGKGLLTLEPNLPFPSDLAQIKTQWLTTWPPAVSLAYSTLLKSGFTPGSATRFLAFLSIASGSLGWLLFFRTAGLPKNPLRLLAVLIPWTSFPVFAMRSFYNDHLLWGVVPWTFLCLLQLPPQGTPIKRKHLAQFITTGLLCGLPFGIKYSAFPLLPAAASFLLFRNGFRFSRTALRESLLFSVFVALPPVAIFLINRLLSGEGSAVLHNGFRLSPVGFQQILHLLLPPLLDVSGWSKIFFHLPSNLSLFSPVCGAALFICLIVSVTRPTIQTSLLPALRLLILYCSAVAGFLFSLTLVFGYFYDWTSETRYYFPVYFGLFSLALALVAHPDLQPKLRAALFLCAGIPTLASITSASAFPFRVSDQTPLPISQLAASHDEAVAYHFLHTLPLPELILSETTLPMNELLVPTVPWFYLKNHALLTSSRPLKVWALLSKEATSQLEKLLPERARVTTQKVPDPFPYQLTQIEFP